MKRFFAMFSFLTTLSSVALATAQIPETLILDGQRRALFTNPLDPWLKAQGNAEKLQPYISPQRCTASWRGYAGLWEIKSRHLVLVKLRANPCNQNAMEIPLSALFQGQIDSVIAIWFSGLLILPDGKQTQYVHMGYHSKYERYIILEVERGKIISQKIVNELSTRTPTPNPSPTNVDPPPRIVP